MKKITSSRSSNKKKTSTGKKKTVYRVKNWNAYNRALKQRGSLRVWIREEALREWRYSGPTQRGAQFWYSDLAIETMLVLRKLLNLPLRQTQGFMESIFERMGISLPVPDYTTLSRRQGNLSVALPVRAKSEPIHLVVDSSGGKIYGEGERKVRQHGWSQRRTWRKLHLGVDADTGEIVAQTLTRAGVDDASQMRPMRKQIRGKVGRCSGDGAYDRWSVLYLLAYPGSGEESIEALIPPRRDARIRQAKRRYRPIQARNERIRTIDRIGRKRWKRQSGYHQRSHAEATISRYKRILGDRFRARSWVGQHTEARIGCLILNRMIHLGKPQAYKVEVAA